MSKIGDVKSILQILQVPPNQQSDLCCLVLLAMASIKEKTRGSKCKTTGYVSMM